MEMERGTRVAVLVLLPIWLAMPVSVSTQPRMGMPMYDKRAEVTVIGTVEEVREMTGMGGMTGGTARGMHVMLKTDKETFEVHLGPVHYLKEQKVDLAKGDAIEVSGARVTMGDRRVILARELRKGDQTWTLRDAEGRPRWRMAPS
jgi:hypothetical protein